MSVILGGKCDCLRYSKGERDLIEFRLYTVRFPRNFVLVLGMNKTFADTPYPLACATVQEMAFNQNYWKKRKY